MNDLNHVLWYLTGAVVLLTAGAAILYLLADAQPRERAQHRPAGHEPSDLAPTSAPLTTNTAVHPAAGTGHSTAELLDHASSLRTAANAHTPWLDLHPPLPHPPEPQQGSRRRSPQRTET
jgi:hypothetical protein